MVFNENSSDFMQNIEEKVSYKSYSAPFSQKEFLQLFHHTFQKVVSGLITIFQKDIHVWDENSSIFKFIFQKSFSIEDVENNHRYAAETSGFFILTKLFTYELIRQHVRVKYSIQIDPILENKTKLSPIEQILIRFKEITQIFEFAPLFGDNPLLSYLSAKSLPDSFNREILTFIIRLQNTDFHRIEASFLGSLFQKLLPELNRKFLGQIYTPTKISKLMADLAVRSPNDVILDPACGCGSLLLQSYRRLIEMSDLMDSNNSHRKTLKQLWGVEISPFPAYISMLSLSFLNLSSITDSVGIIIEDFLKLGPLNTYSVKTRDPKSGKTTHRVLPQKFDAVLANPPYIKQEKIPEKALMMRQLPQFAALRKKGSGLNEKLTFSGKTDYYGFFLWYSTFFLKEGGRLCFIIPNKWMDVKYGEKIKEFLLQNYKIRGIIGFKKNLFPEAQVSTVILIADRCSHSHDRAKNPVQFIQINSQDQMTQIPNLINSEVDIGDSDLYIFDEPHTGVTRTFISQQHLLPIDKWTMKYLYQSQFARVLKGVDLISLDNGIYSRVVGGIKTGANSFFFPSKELLSRFRIPSDFLKPGIKSGRNLPSEFEIEAPIDAFVSIPANLDLRQNPEIALYIKHGVEKEKYPQRPSLHWEPWYAIPENSQDSPDILFLRHINKSFRAYWNKIGAIVADGVRGIKVLDSRWQLFLLGLCNSTFFYWQAHMLGRWEGQGDLQLLVYELRRFQIPNIASISPQQKSNVESAMEEILQKAPQIDQVSPSLQEKLDRAVLACFNLEAHYNLLISETKKLERLRLNKKLTN